jgi:hypothetical protein
MPSLSSWCSKNVYPNPIYGIVNFATFSNLLLQYKGLDIAITRGFAIIQLGKKLNVKKNILIVRNYLILLLNQV